MRRVFIFIVVIILCFAVSGCGGAVETKTKVENPMVEQKTLEDAAKKIGFSMPVFPDDLAYSTKKIYIISDSILQMDLEDATGDVKISLRKSKGSEDISGIYQVEYTRENTNGIPVNMGSYGEIFVAWFEHGGFSYSATAEGMNGVGFDNLLITLTSAIKAEEQK